MSKRVLAVLRDLRQDRTEGWVFPVENVLAQDIPATKGPGKLFDLMARPERFELPAY
jgi:hypothetical protein